MENALRVNHKLSNTYTQSNQPLNNNTTPRKSIISTSLSKNRDSVISRSKISTLPNYKKTDMGKNLSFIERLSEEIEMARVKLREQERQLFNAQNYEVQIKQLSQKCSQSQHQLQEYREELDKMNKICQTIYEDNKTLKTKSAQGDAHLRQLQQQKQKNQELQQEIQRWKGKVKKFEAIKQIQLNELRETMERQRKSFLNRQLKETQIRHNNEINNLRSELRRLQDLQELKNKQYHELLDQYKRSQDQLKELRNYSDKLNEYEQKICMLTQEHMRLSQVNQNKSDLLDQARKKELFISQQLKTQKILKFDNEQLKELLDKHQKEINELMVTNSELQTKIGKAQELQHYLHQMENKYNAENKDRERLARILKEKNAEEENLRNKINYYEKEVLKRQTMEEELSNYEAKMSMMRAQNDRINNILNSRTTQLQNMKNKCMNLQTGHSMINSMEKDKKIYEQKCRNLQYNNEDLHKYISNLQEELNEFKGKDKLSKQTQRSKENLRRENDRLNSTIKSYSEEIQSYRVMSHRIKELQMKLERCDQENLSYENKMVLLSQEIQRLNNLVHNKNQQIQKLQKDKIDLHAVVSKYKIMSTQLQEKQYSITKLKEQLHASKGQLQKQNKKNEDQDRKNRQTITQMKAKEDKLSTDLKNRKYQLQENNRKYNVLKNDLSQLNQLQKVCQKQQNRITVYLRDLQQLKQKNTQFELQLQNERKLSEVLKDEMNKTKSDKTLRSNVSSSELSQRNKDKDRESYEQLISKVQSLQIKINELRKNYQQLLSECLKLQSQKSLSFYGQTNKIL